MSKDLADRRTTCGFFTVSELAKRLEKDNQTVYRHFISKGCPHYPAGSEVFIVETSFVEWLRENEIRRGSESSPIPEGLSASDGVDLTGECVKRLPAQPAAGKLTKSPPRKKAT